MNDTVPDAAISESMIDSRQAANALRLPYYWFADHRMRARHRIPHYQMVGFVRYRISELRAWLTIRRVSPKRDANNADESTGETQ
ncbi:DNA-binding protein [Gammaproteobacteria bacterium]